MGESKLFEEKKSFLRSHCKIAIKNLFHLFEVKENKL